MCAIPFAVAILGLTVLAVGNSVGDWVADTAVARAGKPAMGVASCFGSPLLNDVLGLGIALTVRGDGCMLHAWHENHSCQCVWKIHNVLYIVLFFVSNEQSDAS